MIYSRVPQSVVTDWKDDLDLTDDDAAAVLTWMQSRGR